MKKLSSYNSLWLPSKLVSVVCTHSLPNLISLTETGRKRTVICLQESPRRTSFEVRNNGRTNFPSCLCINVHTAQKFLSRTFANVGNALRAWSERDFNDSFLI